MEAVKAAVDGVKDLAISNDTKENEASSAPAKDAAAPVASNEQKQQKPKGEKKEKKAKKGAEGGDSRPLELSPPAPFIDHRIQIL
jgi:threonyl-tRNA synthetase